LCRDHGASLLGTTQFVKESSDSNVYIACLFTSDGYADTLDPEYMILHNTESAVKQLFELSGGVNIHMPKINAGLFKVPWEKTEAIINKYVPSYQNVTIWEF
jgi:ADP-ribose 1''-phosphate phosphatase